MAKLSNLKARIGNRNWAPSLKTMKEPFLYRIIIEGSINVNRP
eukprot:Gb_26558 [translate_table: standard]